MEKMKRKGNSKLCDGKGDLPLNFGIFPVVLGKDYYLTPPMGTCDGNLKEKRKERRVPHLHLHHMLLITIIVKPCHYCLGSI